MIERRRYTTAGFPSSFRLSELGTHVQRELVNVRAEDGGASKGVLYWQGTRLPKTVVMLMHPRTDQTQNYTIPALVEAGFTAYGQASRWVNNDIATVHETLLLDVAAGVRFLKEECGFAQVVFIGNSGGGSLLSFYQSQAATAPPGRLTATPAGDPIDLNRYTLILADGMIFLAAHAGEGKFLMEGIDPSVTDEHDPLSCDPALDMYNPANGFRALPQESRYSKEFVERYRQAQHARVARLDAVARAAIAEQRTFQAMMEKPDFAAVALEQQQAIGRRAVLGRYMIVYRTEANLAYTDLSISPSDRDVGSLLSRRPDLDNYAEWGFGRYVTPRAWLSTWSGLSSQASVLDRIHAVTVPTLVLNYTGDNGLYPDEAEEIYAASPSRDKKLALVEGDHFGFPLAHKPGKGGREESLEIITAWLRERFPA